MHVPWYRLGEIKYAPALLDLGGSQDLASPCSVLLLIAQELYCAISAPYSYTHEHAICSLSHCVALVTQSLCLRKRVPPPHCVSRSR